MSAPPPTFLAACPPTLDAPLPSAAIATAGAAAPVSTLPTPSFAVTASTLPLASTTFALAAASDP